MASSHHAKRKEGNEESNVEAKEGASFKYSTIKEKNRCFIDNGKSAQSCLSLGPSSITEIRRKKSSYKKKEGQKQAVIIET